MKATLVVLTKLPGLVPVKTRLWPWLGAERAAGIYAWMLFETVSRLRALGRPILAFSPPTASPAHGLPWLADCELLPSLGSDGAQCLAHAVGATFRGEPVVVVGGDSPDLPLSRIVDAVAALAVADLALVPSLDGGFSCLAVREPLSGLEHAFRFGEGSALDSLRRFARERGFASLLLEPWPDVDTLADLLALLRRVGMRASRPRPRRVPSPWPHARVGEP